MPLIDGQGCEKQCTFRSLVHRILKATYPLTSRARPTPANLVLQAYCPDPLSGTTRQNIKPGVDRFLSII